MEKTNLFLKINRNYYDMIFEYFPNKKLKFQIAFYSKLMQLKLNLTMNEFQNQFILNSIQKLKEIFDYNSFLNHLLSINKNVNQEMIDKLFKAKIIENKTLSFNKKNQKKKIKEINSKIIYNFNINLFNPQYIDYILKNNRINFENIRNLNIFNMSNEIYCSFEWIDFEKILRQKNILNNLIKLNLNNSIAENFDGINKMENLKYLVLNNIKRKTANNFLILKLKGLKELEIYESDCEFESNEIFLSIKKLIINGGCYCSFSIKLPNVEIISIKNSPINIQYDSCEKVTEINSDNFDILNLNKILKKAPNLKLLYIEQFSFKKKLKKESNSDSNKLVCFYDIKKLGIFHLINCFEKFTKNNQAIESEGNEKEFKENCELYINDKKIFNYTFEFKECSKFLIEIICNKNLSNTKYMFADCIFLNSFFSNDFITNNILDMSCMFNNCSSLVTIDFSNFNTNNVKDMNHMFYNCSSLISLDISNFNTNNVKDMNHMFCKCYSLTSLNLSNFNTNNVIDMNHMFDCCNSLLSLNISNFNTNNVRDMSYMFSHCSSLNSLNLSHFNIENVSNIKFMFAFCSSLKFLDLTNFNINKEINLSNIFKNLSDKCILTCNDEKIKNIIY